MSFKKPKLYTRYFNSLIDHGDYLEKRSFKKEKLRLEYEYISNLPAPLKPFYPEVHSLADVSGFASYMIAKVNATDSSNLILNKNEFSEDSIINVLNKLVEYLSIVPVKSVSRETFRESVIREICQKNLDRVDEIKKLDEFKDMQSILSDFGLESLDQYAEILNHALLDHLMKESCNTLYFTHGDLCFSNIIIDKDRLILIDPKGAIEPEHNFRPIHYELAKISQSLLGGYDLINHEQFKFVESSEIVLFQDMSWSPVIHQEFEKILNRFGTNLKTIRLTEASLFMSLIPFHKESSNKLKAFLINSLTIYKSLETK